MATILNVCALLSAVTHALPFVTTAKTASSDSTVNMRFMDLRESDPNSYRIDLPGLQDGNPTNGMGRVQQLC